MKLHMLQNGASLADIVISIITNGEVTNRMGVKSRGSSVCIRGSPSWTTIRPIACWCACADGKVHQCVCICCRFTGGRGDACVQYCMYAEHCTGTAYQVHHARGHEGAGSPFDAPRSALHLSTCMQTPTSSPEPSMALRVHMCSCTYRRMHGWMDSSASHTHTPTKCRLGSRTQHGNTRMRAPCFASRAGVITGAPCAPASRHGRSGGAPHPALLQRGRQGGAGEVAQACCGIWNSPRPRAGCRHLRS